MQRASCLNCHRRKLKCSREDAGCSNCKKSGHKCEYPAAEARVRGKRGPYQKKITKRERDLGQELKVTEAKYRQLARQLEEKSGDQTTASPAGVGGAQNLQSPPSCASNQIPYATFPDFPVDEPAAQTHPPLEQMLQLWHVFVTRVDPMTKVLHRPSFEKQLFMAKTRIHDMDESLATLMYSVYYAAVRSTTAAEARVLFGESRDVLTERFEAAMEKSLAAAHISSTPDFMTLQALVLYICTLRRQDSSHQLWPLFGLAVRMAQLLNLGSDDSSAFFLPLETELRRRIWWTLSWLEKRCAEDVASQPASIMTWSSCPFPLNINDDDLDLNSTDMPRPRVGITDMTLCLLRYEMLKLFFDLFSLRPDGTISDSVQRQISLACKKETMLAESKSRLERLYLQHCSITRPFDWLILTFSEGFLSKAELMTRKTGISENEAFQLSLVVLRNTYLIQTDPRAEKWSWLFKDFVQSHALVKVLSELCKGTSSNVESANIADAWAFIERIVDRIPLQRLKDPAVSPIITLMGLARQSRANSSSSQSIASQQRTQPFQAIQEPQPVANYSGAAEPLRTFSDAWAENAIGWGSSFLNAAITSPDSINSNDFSAQSPPDGTTRTDAPMNGFVWPTVSTCVDTSLHIDWGQWNSSLDVFNTRFAPGPA